jgi:DNA-nicking Smr family endonuclease
MAGRVPATGLKPAAARRVVAAPRPPEAAAPELLEDDGTSFASAMADVTPLRDARSRIDAPAPALERERPRINEDAEALATLSDLVAGNGDFDISDSSEYLEGSVLGLDARILRRLRRGEFSYQAMLDLHGHSTAAARAEVVRFVEEARAAGPRCVLIVHGRGHNSRDQVPILKERLKGWLAQGQVGRSILAFTSARPADGGTGAVYVLLRRRRGPREPIDVYEGAKRE